MSESQVRSTVVAFILGLAIAHWPLAIHAYFAIGALWIAATDPLWSGPISRFLWGIVKAALVTAIFLWSAAILFAL
jgi:hypothetical protein